MKELIRSINELFTEEALKPLADYRIVAHQPLNESNIDILADIIDKGVNPEKIYLLPTVATYNDGLAKKVKDRGMNLVWDGWINNTTKHNQKYDRWYNCGNDDFNNAEHLSRNVINGKYQNTLVIDAKQILLIYLNNNIRVTEYNKKSVHGIANYNVETELTRTHLSIIDVGKSRFKFGMVGDAPKDSIFTSALTLGAVYSIFQNEYEREAISKLAEKNPSLNVPEMPNKFRAQQLDLNIEDKIVKAYRIWHGE